MILDSKSASLLAIALSHGQMFLLTMSSDPHQCQDTTEDEVSLLMFEYLHGLDDDYQVDKDICCAINFASVSLHR